MGFCSPEQTKSFLDEAPQFETMLARAGVRLVKYYLDISKDEQKERLADRRSQSAEAVEDQSDRRGGDEEVGRLFRSPRRDVHAHEPRRGAVACGQSQQQEDRAAEHDPAPA